MNNNNFQQLINICNNRYKNMDSANKPYRARNMIVQNVQIPKQNENINEKTPSEEAQPKVETGYIAVGVFTALQALPVPDAVVTIYNVDKAGEENVIYQLITDANGRIPDVKLPVTYSPDNPLGSSKYYFTTYNMRVQAINYYTTNVLDIRVFPDITTNYRINLIPVMSGDTNDHLEKTIVIPPSPVDKSND